MVSGLVRRALAPSLIGYPQPLANGALFLFREGPGSSILTQGGVRLSSSANRLFSTGQSALPSFVGTTNPKLPNQSIIQQRIPSWHAFRKQENAATWLRSFSTAPQLQQQQKQKGAQAIEENKENQEESELEFKKSDRAAQAAQVNLAAKLSKEGRGQGKAGMAEVLRLIKVARPELRWLALAFVFLVISSSVTMSIPFSVGRIMDLATKGDADDIRLFGLTLNQFFMGLAGILTLGAMANFGRVVLLRIVGERVVARLRSQLYRRTYVQDAEFFDANRVGDLISRLSSDTVIVGKSVTQNLSDGLRALFSGGAGFAIMVWTSPKLTGLLLLVFPPIAVGAFFYGRTIRNISRSIQKNLGTLTKIAE